MANYGYIRLPRTIQAHDFAASLTAAVGRALGVKWQVRLADYEYDGVTWEVFLPGTAITDEVEALNKWQAVGEDIGFPVALSAEMQTATIAFRHSSHPFERWAQGCLEEELADHFKVGVLYDATDEVRKPGTRLHREPGSFKAYLSRNFAKPLTPEDEKYLNERYAWTAPPGFWD